MRRRKWAIALLVLMAFAYATWRTRWFFRPPPRGGPTHGAPHSPQRSGERDAKPLRAPAETPTSSARSTSPDAPAGERDEQRAAALGVLAGRVLVRGTGEPVGGATLHIEWAATHEPGLATTAHDGSFVFRGAPVGSCQIGVEAEGFWQATAQLAQVVVADPRDRDGPAPVDVLVDRAVAVSGHVVEMNGAPVSGATIATRGNAAGERATSDSDGRFTLRALVAGTDLAVEHPSFARTMVPWSAIWQERERGLEITLAPGARVSGEVVGANGARAARTQVRVTVRAPGAPVPTIVTSTTASDGRFELRSLPAGDAYLEAVPLEGGVTVTLEPFALDPGQERSNVVIQLRDLDPESSIEGSVRSSDGSPVRGATITAGRAAVPPTRVQTDAEGGFRLSGLAPGDYALTAQAPGHQWTRLPSVRAGTTGLEITLARGGVVTGRVVDGRTGEPLRSFQLGGQPIETNDGRFEYAALDTKRATFVVRAEGYASRELGPFDAAGRDSIDAGTVSLQPEARVRGQALDAHGEPLTGATVFAVSLDAPSQRTWERATTDITGAYEIGGLAAGRWCIATSLRASRDGCSGGAQLRTRPGEVLDRIRITAGD
ncbi:MAG: carboxypeptidase-like regulatory domain-containing protein [bacterium]